MSKAEGKRKEREQAAPKQRRNQIFVVIAVLLLAVGAGWAVKTKFFAGQAASTPRLEQPAAAKLVGRWRRPDGGYVIEIRQAGENGRLDVSYFNPRSIHVSQANFSRTNGTLRVFVELNDANYPGATYKLSYNPDQDQLAGLYHQPLVGQTFEVVFARTPQNGPAR